VAGHLTNGHRSTVRSRSSSRSFFDELSALVDNSLIGRERGPSGELRFAMLETIREFGLERLAGFGWESAVRDRHARCFLAIAERAEAAFWGFAPGDWRELLDGERDNFREAIAWALERGDAELALRLSAALDPFWWPFDHQAEGRKWLLRALAVDTLAIARHGRRHWLSRPASRWGWRRMVTSSSWQPRR